MALKHPSARVERSDELSIQTVFTLEGTNLPRHRLPDGELPPDVAYQIVHDELMLDGNARMNLATFVGTWMEPQAGLLMAECRDKNMIDKDEYPRTAELERRCVAMLADLWNAPDPTAVMGCSTTGSSEACMLAGMALKRRWMKRNADRYPEARPNLVMGINVQVCWEKFCTYWEVEPRLIPMEGERFHLDPLAAAELCDENTIGVVGILGSTFDGSYEPIADLCSALDDLQESTGLDIPVHVDGASGAMVAPFLQPHLEWDFRVPRVASINTSGHKYGLVNPGLGWILWRDRNLLPESLVFKVSYLGGEMPTFGLNFSRPAAQVLVQYFQFLRLGRLGYREVQKASRDVARHLADRIGAMDCFDLWHDASDIPVFAWRKKAGHNPNWTLYDVSDRLRMKGWLVPAYPMPDNLSDTVVQRVVIRNGMSMDLAANLLADLEEAVRYLDKLTLPLPDAERSVFHH